MFTSLDKALVAIAMAVLFLLKQYFGIDLGISEATVAQIMMFITGLLVYFTPNKQT